MITTLYLATSTDHFITGNDGDISWLEAPGDIPADAYKDSAFLGYEEFLNTVDVIVMGAKSYTDTLPLGPWAWEHIPTYVFSETDLQPTPNVSFVRGDVTAIMQDITKKHGAQTGVWLFGGANLADSFEKAGLIDVAVITVIPTFVKEGIQLTLTPEHLSKQFSLTDEVTFVKGIKQYHWKKNGPSLLEDDC